ncbi:hypothetical protein QYF61_022001 [Mycteria americana]|uniref:very-long-chain 3-oxoacyl-CoA synthase n=1 Tax=Mycteria americana TaxID=33587 RepID=A0AAN7SFM7_MYCAM|nr:hypothetical protein QYF61_022001 [Mycteria americana]
MEVHSRADIHLQPVEDPTLQQVDMSQGKLQPMEDPMQKQAPGRSCSLWRRVHAGASFLAGPVAWERPTLEQSISEGLHPMERTHTGAVLQELQPIERTHVGEVLEELQPIQFLLTIVHTLSAAVKPCGFPFGCLMFQSSYMATLVILFINFYIKTYRKAPSRTAIKETPVTTEIKNGFHKDYFAAANGFLNNKKAQ